MASVAVIGGGLSGLSAAYRLTQRNVQVAVFEAASRSGGVIRSERCDGYLIEYGPNSIEGTTPVISGLIHELGLEQQCIEANQSARRLYIVRGGQLLPLPHSPAAFFSSRLFSLSTKLRVLREPLIKRSASAEEESVANFIRRRLGTEILDYAISPFVTGTLAGDPERLSVRHAFPNLYTMEQQYGSLIKGQISRAKERKHQSSESRRSVAMFSFREGMQTLTDALHACIRNSVRLNTPVSRLQQTQSGWIVTALVKNQAISEHFDAVLYTAPLHQLPTIRIEPAIDLKPLADMYYPPLSILVLSFRREDVHHPLDGFGMLIPEAERFNIFGTLFSSTIFNHRAHEGYVMLTNYIGGARNPELAMESTEALLEVTMQDLRATLGVSGQPTYVKHIPLKKSVPQYNIGYGQLKKLMDQTETQHTGFFMAGNYRRGIPIRDVISSGYEVAENIFETLGCT